MKPKIMNLKMLSKIVICLWYDGDDVDEIGIQLRLKGAYFRHDVMTYTVILPLRDLSINDEDELNRVIDDALLTGITNLTKVTYENVYDSKIPRITEVRTSPSYNFEDRIDVEVTLSTLREVCTYE